MVDPNSDTAAVDSQFLRTVTIHGRVYQKHSTEHTVHFEPVDEEEAESLHRQHRVLDILFDRKLIFPPLTSVKNVLDLGYGSAAWALEVAEAYPKSTVVGIDISPQLKLDDTPENFWPQLDDLNKPFTFKSNTFDLVHSRLVAGGINKTRWPTYIGDIVRVLRPGGWVQMVECYYMCQSDNGSISDDNALRQWSEHYIKAMGENKDPRAPLQLQNMFNVAGLVDVESKMMPMPLCGWANDARGRRIGCANRDIIQHCLGTLSLYPFTRILGMSIDAYDELVGRASAIAIDPSFKAYFPIYVCIGRKPGG